MSINCDQCYPDNNQAKPIIFECGTGNGFTYSTNGDTISLTSPCQACVPKTVGVVTVDTSGLKRPKTLVQFSSNVHFTERNSTGTVQMEFQLFRTCDNRQEEPLGTWYYEIEDEDDNFAETFSFFYCDCNSCPGCCVYTVRCKPIEIDDASICVTNCHIAAFAQSNC